MNDLPAQIFMYLPFGVVFVIVFACLFRLHFDRKSDEQAEAEFENIERLSDRARNEARESTIRAGEIKDGISKISERTDSARKQLESASEEISRARTNNRTAEEAVARIEEILSEAKKI